MNYAPGVTTLLSADGFLEKQPGQSNPASKSEQAASRF